MRSLRASEGRGYSRNWTTWRARKAALEQELASDPPPPLRLHPNLAQVYRGKVERLHEALADPGLRDEALGILRGLIERVEIHPGEDGLQVEIVGEIVKMVELGWTQNRPRSPRRRPVRSRWLRGQDLDFVHFS
jgi:hypothetical protein